VSGEPRASGTAPHDGTGAPRPHDMDPLERTVQRVLQAGVVVSFAFMVAGIVLAVSHGEGLAVHVVPLGRLGAGLAALDSAAYVSLGLMVLIATPFMRVAGSLIAFLGLRDRRYTLVTAVVLFVMCLSVLLGRA
jgi:uncharacterized membrane protein